MRRAERLELFKDAMYIPEVVHQIGQNDDIKFLVQVRKVMRVGVEECKFRIVLLCTTDHLFREINPNTASRFYRGKQVSFGAAYLQDFLMRTDVKTVNLVQTALIPAA